MKAIPYIFRRLASGVLLLIGVSVLSFLLSSMVPGSYLDEMRLNPQVSQQTVAELRAYYRIDRPIVGRYFDWLSEVAAGNWGFSFAYQMPTSKLVLGRCGNTLLLAATATLVVWMIALPLGILAATRGAWLDHVLSLGSSFLLSVPELAVILTLLALAVRTGSLPIGGMTGGNESLGLWLRMRDIGSHMLVPVLALSLAGMPVVVHHTRAAMKQVLEAPFIQAARGHGVQPMRLWLLHALPAAANPLISLFGFSLAGLIGTSLLTEVVTGWPGLGPLFLQSIFARDLYVVIAIVMLSSSFLVIGNLVGDLLLYAVDPRIRAW